MIGYRICQIRLMVPGDGVHPGLESVLYHSIQVMLLKPQIDKVPAGLVYSPDSIIVPLAVL